MLTRAGLIALALLLAACTKDLELPPDPSRAPPGTLYGRVVVPVPGQSARRAAPGATIELLGTSLSVRADGEGRFLLEGVVQREGRLLVRFDADGDGRPDRQRLLDIAGLGAGPGRQIAVGDVAVAESARMRGRVLLGDRAGAPAGHRLTTVYVPGAPFTTVTNDDGSWTLAELPEGPVQVSFFHPGYVPADLSGLALRAGEDFLARELVLAKEPAPPPPGSITGLVVLAPGADAAAPDPAGADVVALDALGRSLPAALGAGGVYRIADVPAGLYDLRASRDGYATAVVRNLLVSSAEALSLPPIVLQPGASTATCAQGSPCSLPACRAGRTDCASGVSACVDAGPAVDGAACGTDQVCSSGACVACAEGAACVPEGQPCMEGRTTCRTGAPVCVALETSADGRACGAGAYCRLGACKPCDQGGACDLTDGSVRGGDCRQGTTDCATGEPVCRDLGVVKPAGTPCGGVDGMVCSGADCVPCALPPLPERGCRPVANPCHEGVLSCATGRLTCEDLGTPGHTGLGCGAGRVCNQGSCDACDDDPARACTPPNTTCRKGAPSCATGAFTCVDYAPADDGTACGAGRVCRAGSCVQSGFNVVSGNGGAARVASAAAPVVVRLTDGAGQPLANVAITVSSPDGGGAVPSVGATNAQGRFTFSPRMPRQRGTYDWRVTAADGQGSVLVSMEATSPPPGVGLSLVNADHGPGDDGVPGPGPLAHVGRVLGVATASDGTVYFTDGTYHRVRRLSPSGQLTTVAGTGLPGLSGDGGPAAQAQLSTPFGLALDDTPGARVLYVADQDNQRIRAIDLEAGTIDTVVGGNAAAAGPGFGDGSTGRSAALYGPTQLSFGPDRKLYFVDRGRGRVRRWDPETALVSAFLTPVNGCTTEPLVFSGCGNGPGCRVAFDAAGDAWIGGYFTGAAVGNACNVVPAVARRESATGRLVHVAGVSGGSTLDGVPSTSARLLEAPVVAVAPAGDVLLLDEQARVLRRVEAGYGRIRTVAGAWLQGGHGADGAALAEVRLESPSSMALLPGGDVVVADTGNAAVRLFSAVAAGPAAQARLEAAGGDGQIVFAGQAAPALLAVRLTDADGLPLSGYVVRWRAMEAGGGLYATSSTTDAAGVASVRARAGRRDGVWRFEASFVDFGGRAAAGSPVTLTLTAKPATPGTVRTIVNLDHSRGDDVGPVAGPIGRTGGAHQLALAADGTLYFADFDHHRVRVLSPGGELSTLAGSGQAASAGDGGPARDAALHHPFGVALDERARALYVSEYAGGRVRRIDLATGLIATYAGGGGAPAPSYGDSGPATQASLSSPTFLALGPDGALYVVDRGHERVRRVLASGTIGPWLTSAPGCTQATLNLAGCSDLGCLPAWDADGNAYVGGLLNGTAVGSGCNVTPGLVRVEAGTGRLTHLAGRAGGFAGDGRYGTDTELGGVPLPAVDAARNVLFTEPDTHRVRRLEARTGRVTTIAGQGAGYAGDWEPVAVARFGRPMAPAIDLTPVNGGPLGSLVVPDRDNHAVRVLQGVVDPALPAATLASAGRTAQSPLVAALAPELLAVKLSDGQAALVGYPVRWRVVTPGGALYQEVTLTDAGGTARALARAGRAAGDYVFEASFAGIDGTPATGSPVRFTLAAKSASAGTVFTVANVDRTAGTTGTPGPATLARLEKPHGLALAADGSVYVAERTLVRRLTPAGELSTVAGNGTAGSSGDYGPATGASLNEARGVSLDAAGAALYVSEFLGHAVRRVDLATGGITTVLGRGGATGPGWGDNGPGTSAVLDYPTHLARGPDGALYVTDAGHQRIRRYDPATTVVTSWLDLPTTPDTCSSVPVNVGSCENDGCSVAFDAVTGDAYVSAMLYGTSPNVLCFGGVPGIVRRSPSGQLTHVAGVKDGVEEGAALALQVSFGAPPALALDGRGGLLTVDPAKQRIRRIDLATGRVRDVAGTGVAGFAGEYSSALASQWRSPAAALLLPDGGLLVSDKGNHVLRQIAPSW